MMSTDKIRVIRSTIPLPDGDDCILGTQSEVVNGDRIVVTIYTYSSSARPVLHEYSLILGDEGHLSTVARDAAADRMQDDDERYNRR